MKQDMNLIYRLLRFALFLIIVIFTNDTVAQRTSSSDYQDFEKKCDNGQRVSAIKSELNKDGLRTLSVSCADLPNRAGIQATCNYKPQPIKCDNQPEGCGNGEWLAGLKGTDIGASSYILEPYCCKASGVQIQSCSEPQLQGFQGQAWDSQLGQDEAFNGIQCWLITDRDEEILDAIYKMSKCKVAGGGGGGNSGGGEGDGGGILRRGDKPTFGHPEDRSKPPTQRFVIVQTQGTLEDGLCNCMCNCTRDACSPGQRFLRFQQRFLQRLRSEREAVVVRRRVNRQAGTCDCACKCFTDKCS